MLTMMTMMMVIMDSIGDVDVLSERTVDRPTLILSLSSPQTIHSRVFLYIKHYSGVAFIQLAGSTVFQSAVSYGVLNFPSASVRTRCSLITLDLA